MAMQALFPDCPRCGNVVGFRQGHSVGLRCTVAECRVGVAWSYRPPIELDRVVYAIYACSLGGAWKEKGARLAVRFGIPLSRVAQSRGTVELPLFRGGAPEVFRIREELARQDIPVRIEPSFPYDVYDSLPEGEFAPSREQVDSLAQAMKDNE